MKTINTDKAPKAIGPYSQAVLVNKLIFCSGQVGIIPKTGELAQGLEKQTQQVLKNLEAVLKSSGSSLNHVVKTTVYLKNMADFPKMNLIYEQFFQENKPARATVAVLDLPKKALVEIDCIAVK